MLPEISLNILDVAQNSIRAEAQVISITVDVNQDRDDLVITIEDDGCGMTAEQIRSLLRELPERLALEFHSLGWLPWQQVGILVLSQKWVSGQ